MARTESSPYLLYAAILVVVGASVAVPAGLWLANREPPVVGVGGADAGVSPMAHAGAGASGSAHSPSDEDAGAATATATATADAGAKASASASASAKPEATGPGFLTISTSPSARVSEKGRVMCTSTPCARLPLSAGSHTITLENKEESMKSVIVVTITSGEITSKRVTLKAVP